MHVWCTNRHPCMHTRCAQSNALFCVYTCMCVAPPTSPTCNRLNECMDLIFTKAPTLAVKGKPKPNAKTSNANHSIFFELCNLIVHYDNDAERQAKVCAWVWVYTCVGV